MKRTLLTALVVAAAALSGASAYADPPKPPAKPPQAEVTVIHATKCEKKSVDPALGDNPPKLGFDCLKMLDRQKLPLVLNQGSTMALPNGRQFQLIQNAMVGPRFKLAASISPPDGSAGFTKLAEITTDASQPPFNVGGFTYQGGVLVLMVRVLPSS